MEGLQDPRKKWKEKDSERRAMEHKAKHAIPGMNEWLDKMRKGNEERPQ